MATFKVAPKTECWTGDEEVGFSANTSQKADVPLAEDVHSSPDDVRNDHVQAWQVTCARS